MEILQKIDKSVLLHHLTEFNGVSNMAIYDIKRQGEKLPEFYSENEYNKGIANHKSLHEARSANLDRLV